MFSEEVACSASSFSSEEPCPLAVPHSSWLVLEVEVSQAFSELCLLFSLCW